MHRILNLALAAIAAVLLAQAPFEGLDGVAGAEAKDICQRADSGFQTSAVPQSVPLESVDQGFGRVLPGEPR